MGKIIDRARERQTAAEKRKLRRLTREFLKEEAARTEELWANEQQVNQPLQLVAWQVELLIWVTVSTLFIFFMYLIFFK